MIHCLISHQNRETVSAALGRRPTGGHFFLVRQLQDVTDLQVDLSASFLNGSNSGFGLEEAVRPFLISGGSLEKSWRPSLRWKKEQQA